jgi:hypothetical protein
MKEIWLVFMWKYVQTKGFRKRIKDIFNNLTFFPAPEWCVMDTVYQNQEPRNRSVDSFEVICFANLKI